MAPLSAHLKKSYDSPPYSTTPSFVEIMNGPLSAPNRSFIPSGVIDCILRRLPPAH